MIGFVVLWLCLLILRGAAYFRGSDLTLQSTSLGDAKERWGFAGIALVILEVGFANEINVIAKPRKYDLFFPLLVLFVAATSGLISFGICRWLRWL